jgi:hypothetical protein
MVAAPNVERNRLHKETFPRNQRSELMPVIINRRPTVPSSPLPLSLTPGEKLKMERNHLHEIRTEPTRKRGRRGQHFDKEVERLAPYLAAAREAGHHSERAMMTYLNEQRVPPPAGTGGRWTAGTMHRVLVRERELKLGPGPRSSKDAAIARPSRAGQGAGRRKPREA